MMLTEYTDFYPKPWNAFPKLCFIIGKEPLLASRLEEMIKKSWFALYENRSESFKFELKNSKDWEDNIASFQNHQLFSTHQLLIIEYEKKTLDAFFREGLIQYLSSNYQDICLMVKAPLLTPTTLNIFSKQSEVDIYVLKSPPQKKIMAWIQTELKNLTQTYDKRIPEMIYRYHEGNLRAMAAFLKKLTFIITPEIPLSKTMLQEHLFWQTNYSLYQLPDLCFQGDFKRARQLLSQIRSHKIEPTLLLWVITEEIRKLIILSQPSQHETFQTSAKKLKIWPSKFGLYQMAMQKYSITFLSSLLQRARKLDEYIKTYQVNLVWHQLDWMILSLCLGKEVP